MSSAPILAHAVTRPGDLWAAWAGQPAVAVALVAVALLYVRGHRAGRGRAALAPVLRRRRRAAVAGATVLAVALASPLDAAAGALFSAHMVQHLLLTSVAAPLLVLAAPVATIRRGLTPAWRSALDRWWRPPPGDGRIRRWTPLLGAGTSLAVLSTWHVPAVYDAALRSDLLHGLEHLTLLGAGALLWSGVIGAGRRHQVLSAVGALALACLHGAALGALLALSSRPWYGEHATAAEGWGVDALADQQIAGAVMWVPAGAIYLVAAAVLLHRALAPGDPTASGRHAPSARLAR